MPHVSQCKTWGFLWSWKAPHDWDAVTYLSDFLSWLSPGSLPAVTWALLESLQQTRQVSSSELSLKQQFSRDAPGISVSFKDPFMGCKMSTTEQKLNKLEECKTDPRPKRWESLSSLKSPSLPNLLGSVPHIPQDFACSSFSQWALPWPPPLSPRLLSLSWVFLFPLLFFYSFLFNRRIIALQYCVGFYQPSTWNSHRFAHFSSCLNIPPTPGPSHQDMVTPRGEGNLWKNLYM